MKIDRVLAGIGKICGFLFVVVVIKLNGSDFCCVRKSVPFFGEGGSQ